MDKSLSLNLLLRHLFVFIFLLSFVNAESFDQSKKILKNIYTDHQTTFYCGCNYTYENQGNMIDRKSCGYVPRNATTKKGNPNERAGRIEWEHIMPVPFIFSKYGQEKSLKLYVVKS